MAIVDSLTKVADKLKVTQNTKGTKAVDITAINQGGNYNPMSIVIYFNEEATAEFSVVAKTGDTDSDQDKEALKATFPKEVCAAGTAVTANLQPVKGAKFVGFEFSGASTITAWLV